MHTQQQRLGRGQARHRESHNTLCRNNKNDVRPHVIVAAQRSMGKEVVVGIDLGTTNSAVAYIENGKPKCIPNAEGSRITPSVVSFTSDGDVIVGKAARKQAASSPQTTYYSVKRLIGRPFADPIVQEEAARLAFKVSQDDQGQTTLVCSSVDRGYIYPEEVSAQVLAQLLDDAESYTGGQVKKAVISVPAYFNDKQRDTTANAGKLAGLEVVRIIREPVAAALAYGLNLKEDQTVLVFDLGGGTYDISLLEVGNGTVEVLSTGGDAHLGGDDWDALLVDWIINEHLSKANPPVDASNNPKLRANLRSLAEVAKIQLTNNEEVQLRMPIGGPKGGPLELTFTRQQFEQLSEPLWQKARLPLDQACWAAGVDLNSVMSEMDEKREALKQRGVPAWKTETMRPEIRPKARAPLSKVLLVGGASRMPAVASFIKNMTGLYPESTLVNPDEAVALGAAVQAGILQGEVRDLMVLDQWQASLMRALAKMQLKENKTAREAVEEKFDMQVAEVMEDDDEEAELVRQERAILAQLDEEHEAESAASKQGTSGNGRPPKAGSKARQRKGGVGKQPRRKRHSSGSGNDNDDADTD